MATSVVVLNIIIIIIIILKLKHYTTLYIFEKSWLNQ